MSDHLEDEIEMLFNFELATIAAYLFLKRPNRREFTPYCDRGLYRVLLDADDATFTKMLRLSRSEFEYLLKVITPDIERGREKAVPIDQKLLVTLHFLAHGTSKFKTALDFDLGEATICMVLDEVCQAIVKRLAPVYLAYPSKQEWKQVEEGFWQRWNVPNMLGVIDGKLLQVRKPQSGNAVFTTTIMAVVDYQCKFLVIDIGDAEGDCNDFVMKTPFSQALYDDCDTDLDWPDPKPFPDTQEDRPHFLVGDDAFRLHQKVMKPYPGRGFPPLPQKKRIFNYRISRPQQVGRNAFGILAARWGIFQTEMCATPERASQYIHAAMVLHNMLCTTRRDEYIPEGFADEECEGTLMPGSFRQQAGNSQLKDVPACLIRNSPRNAGKMRESLADFFTTDTGRHGWKEEHVMGEEDVASHFMDTLHT